MFDLLCCTVLWRKTR